MNPCRPAGEPSHAASAVSFRCSCRSLGRANEGVHRRHTFLEIDRPGMALEIDACDAGSVDAISSDDF
jgi:hypothetical protein